MPEVLSFALAGLVSKTSSDFCSHAQCGQQCLQMFWSTCKACSIASMDCMQECKHLPNSAVLVLDVPQGTADMLCMEFLCCSCVSLACAADGVPHASECLHSRSLLCCCCLHGSAQPGWRSSVQQCGCCSQAHWPQPLRVLALHVLACDTSALSSRPCRASRA